MRATRPTGVMSRDQAQQETRGTRSSNCTAEVSLRAASPEASTSQPAGLSLSHSPAPTDGREAPRDDAAFWPRPRPRR